MKLDPAAFQKGLIDLLMATVKVLEEPGLGPERRLVLMYELNFLENLIGIVGNATTEDV